jgi:hypothetical protein
MLMHAVLGGSGLFGVTVWFYAYTHMHAHMHS